VLADAISALAKLVVGSEFDPNGIAWLNDQRT
jgi:hypothetical protein